MQNERKSEETNKQQQKKSNPRKPPNLELLMNLDDQKLTPDPDGALVIST